MPVRTTGVDWAVYQAKGDHKLLKRQGATFLIAKVSQDHGADSFGAEHIRRARAAGLIPGAYHFLIEPGVGKKAGYRGGAGALSAEAQARNFIARARAANGGTLDGLICALDLEALNNTSMDGTNRRIGSKPNARHARAFVAEFHRLEPGRPIVLYTSYSYLRQADLRKWSQPVGLWLAWWSMSSENLISSGRTGIPESRWSTRYGGVFPSIIQFQSGSHGGRAGGVWSDLCASNLTRAQLLEQLTRPKAATPEPDPEPAPDPSTTSTHRSRPSPAACLREAPTSQAPALAQLPPGVAIRAVRGRIGGWYRVGGLRSCLWLEVSALGGHRIRPTLWAPELAFRPVSPPKPPKP
jgi:GH25 family lysozyme M1 (1,4-beta-N-acetylmuramidase)